ncbi:uncharacterized protein LOC119608871 [Lucilia sericata]|uniref:uncharacterized protein LOC119608871 n=1 Tax=Lucilia sericata TaxID=13632 RepID=UPI0018A85751|nr:uncharacterized protein LOC119608871 [Lucilia sericata]
MTSKLWLLFCLLTLQEHVHTETNTSPQGLKNLLIFNLTPAATNDSCAYFNLYKHLFEEMDSQNHPMIQVYYNRVIQKLYDSVPAHILFLQLWQIYNKCDPSTFVAMVRAQLSLFWLHNMNEYPDNDYLLMVANGLYKIKNYYLYNSLNTRTQVLFERAMKSLPNSLHNLFGHQEFCLMNRKYQEMLYQTNSDEFVTNQEIRFAFTWHFMKRYNDGKGKIKPVFDYFNLTSFGEDEDDDLIEDQETTDLVGIPSTLTIALYSKHFKNFYSRWPVYDQKIGGNLSGIPEFTWQQDYHVWSVKIVDDDQLVFFQNQYVMCATSFYDNKRRFVFGVKNRSLLDTECQWSAGKCDRR